MEKTALASLQKGIFVFPNFGPSALAVFSSREFDAAKDLPFFLKSLGVDSHPFSTLQQVHGNKIVVVSSKEKTNISEADAIVTGERNLPILIRTADCLPVFFLDSTRSAIGLAHAGWRGVQKKIIQKTMDTLRSHFGSRPENIQVALGPAIRECCYEVGDEFSDYFPDFVRKKKGKNHFDLIAAAVHQLEDAGIPISVVTDSGICTACSTDRFFSARREGQNTGRLLSALMLR